MLKFEDVLLYQFGFYAPDSRIDPSPEIIAKLLKAFDGTGYMPSAVTEMHVEGSADGKHRMQARQQLHLVTKNGEWAIEFEPHRVSIKKRNVTGVEIGTAEQFKDDVADFCERLSTVRPLTGTRLSYVTRGFLPEKNADEMVAANQNIMILPGFYQENPPIEWNTRTATQYDIQLHDRPETLNVITDIGRIRGKQITPDGAKDVDRIDIGFDINTFQENKEQRFVFSDAKEFLEKTVELSERLLDDFEGMLS